MSFTSKWDLEIAIVIKLGCRIVICAGIGGRNEHQLGTFVGYATHSFLVLVLVNPVSVQ